MRARAYVDTSAFISFLDRSDTHHELFKRLFADPPSLLTSPLVIAEGQGWFLRRYDRHRALQFLAFIDELRPLEIVSMGGKELSSARSVLRKFSDSDLTLADALGLDLMRRHRIRVCWSADRHLSLTGVPLVIHQI